MIKAISLKDLADQLNGELYLAGGCGEDTFSQVSTDSRTIKCGELFVALIGERFDGHASLDEVREKGAVAAVVEHRCPVDIPQIIVSNSLKALGQIGEANRDEFGGTLVGITGSSGKTSVKEMIAAILRLKGKTLATQGNFNNEIGVPLTLLNIEESHEFAVVEMGASKLGDIAYTAQFAKPDVSVLVNASEAHLGVFGSYENIVQTKGEIVSALQPEGTAVLNCDDPAFEQWQEMAGERSVMGFGLDPHSARMVAAENVAFFPDKSSFELKMNGMSKSIQLSVPGKHNVSNALAAAGACGALGLSLDEIAQGLNTFSGVSGRLERVHLGDKLSVINDSYNANPASTRAALDVLASCGGVRVAVLGNMAELGDSSAELHGKVGAYAKAKGIEILFACGAFSESTATGFGDRGESFPHKEEMLEALKAFLNESVDKSTTEATVLVKGSRSAAMEDVVNMLQQYKVEK